MNIQEYKKQREEEYKETFSIVYDDDSTLILRAEKQGKIDYFKLEEGLQIISNFNTESIDGTVALIEKEIEGMKKEKREHNMFTCEELDCDDCDTLSNYSYNLALQDLLSSLKGNK